MDIANPNNAFTSNRIYNVMENVGGMAHAPINNVNS